MSPDLLYSLAAYSVVLTGLFSIPVRFFRPERDLTDFRGKKSRTIVITWWLTCLVLLPYAINPASENFYVFSRGAMVLIVPPYITKFIKCYYEDSWVFSWKMALVRGPLMAAYIIFCLFTDHPEAGYYLAVFFGMIEICYLARHLTRVVCILNNVHSSEYSSPDDFRFRTVVIYLYAILTLVVAIYALFLFSSRTAMAARDMLLVILNCIFLTLSTFPPGHILRAGSPTGQIVSSYKPEADAAPVSSESSARMEHVKEQIVEIVERKRGFLDPHLSLDKIVEQLDCGKTMASKVMTHEFGGFYNYVNGLRVVYADDYAKTHPFATKDEIADSSGFSSRQTLASASKKLKQNIQN